MAGTLSPTGDERTGALSPSLRSQDNLEAASPPPDGDAAKSPFNRACAPTTTCRGCLVAQVFARLC